MKHYIDQFIATARRIPRHYVRQFGNSPNILKSDTGLATYAAACQLIDILGDFRINWDALRFRIAITDSMAGNILHRALIDRGRLPGVDSFGHPIEPEKYLPSGYSCAESI